MATRQTRHILKNSDIVNRPLPGSLLKGEPIVNTADGIMYFSGVTTSTNEWTPAGTGTTVNFFEVGSNLYDLRLRNRITKYEGTTSLSGKFLSGTTNGFVLADISSIAGSVDSYVTGATWSPNTLTITLNNGKPNVPVTIDTFNGLTLYGSNIVNGNLTVTGTTNLNGLSYYNNTANSSNEIVNYSTLTSYTQNIDVYVTGSTLSSATNNTKTQTSTLSYHGVPIGGPYSIVTENTFVTGGTFNSGTITLRRNDGVSIQVSGLTSTDIYVTGFTYNPSNNSLTISQNQGQPDLSAYIDTVSGLTISNLTIGQVVYVGSDGKLKTDTVGEFAYNDSTNTLTIGTTTGKLVVNNGLSDGPSTFGQGGLTIGSGGSHGSPGIGDLTVHGNFIVFGTGTTVATNELYVEDPQITLNYNPTGDTSSTSISSGIRIQDGNGTSTGDTYFTITQLNTLTGLTSTQIPSVTEYTGSVGYENRGWLTQLNDIVIRNTNLNNGAPNGVRVLAEFDTLDGGTY